MRIVVVVDADLLVAAGAHSGLASQREAVRRVVARLADLLASPHQVALVHGNAPQVGAALLRAELARQDADPLPLDVANSDTQGSTGYLLQQAIRNSLRRRESSREVATVITQALVDVNDPAFLRPSRGVGPNYDEETARRYAMTRSWAFILEPGRGYRRAVASLEPVAIIEQETICKLLEDGVVVICAGGGGVPVYYDGRGDLESANALIDKISTAGLLAAEIQADVLAFVLNWDTVVKDLQITPGDHPHRLTLADLTPALEGKQEIDRELCKKLVAAEMFLKRGGQEVWLAPAERPCRGLENFAGVIITA